jgi:hypothetical protein
VSPRSCRPICSRTSASTRTQSGWTSHQVRPGPRSALWLIALHTFPQPGLLSCGLLLMDIQTSIRAYSHRGASAVPSSLERVEICVGRRSSTRVSPRNSWTRALVRCCSPPCPLLLPVPPPRRARLSLACFLPTTSVRLAPNERGPHACCSYRYRRAAPRRVRARAGRLVRAHTRAIRTPPPSSALRSRSSA